MLQRAGREPTTTSRSGSTSGVCYNPLHNDLDPYAVAYAIATLLNNLFGKSKEPFWQQAYTDLLKFVILLRRITDGYTTFSEVYRYILDDAADRPRHPPPEGRHWRIRRTSCVIRTADYQAHCVAARRGATGSRRTPTTWRTRTRPTWRRSWRRAAFRYVVAEGAGHGVDRAQAPARGRRAMVRARLESSSIARLRSSIVEGVVVFLSLFDDNPAVHRAFCPPRSAYTEEPAAGRATAARRRSTRCSNRATCWPSTSRSAMNPGLARILGVMLKLDFQRAMLQRIPQIAAQPERGLARPAVRLRRVPRVRHGGRDGPDRRRAHLRAVAAGAADADRGHAEHQLAAVGAARRRELADAAAVLPHQDLPGDQRRVHRAQRRGTVRPARSAEGALQHRRSPGGTRTSRCSPGGATAAQAVAEREQELRAARTSTSSRRACSRELQNAQAVALPYDGVNPLPPQFCYLKPHYLDVQTSYFDHLERGRYEQPGSHSAVPASDRGPARRPGHHRGDGQRRRAARVRGAQRARSRRCRIGHSRRGT